MENVAEVTAAAAAEDFGSGHSVASIEIFEDFILIDYIGKGGPAAVGVEFAVGPEQDLAAGGAFIDAGLEEVIVFAGEGAFGTFLPEDEELIGGQFLLPFPVTFYDSLGFGGFFRLDLGCFHLDCLRLGNLVICPIHAGQTDDDCRRD